MKWLIFLTTLAIGATASPSIQLYKDTLTEPEGRITNGRECDRREIRYQVSVHHATLIVSSHICGGILISRKHVLTAAQCKRKRGRHSAVLGQYKRGEIHRDVQKIDADEFIIHEKYTEGIAKYDIGLLVLKKEVRLSPAVEPINLPSSVTECDGLALGLLSGWGYTGSLLPTLAITLRCAKLLIITNEECRRNLTALTGNAFPLDDTMICTGTNVGNEPQSACSGDIGGPLADKVDNVIFGIASWGVDPCGTEGAPYVYTKVCSYLEWIYYHMIN